MYLFCSGIWSGSNGKHCQKFMQSGEVFSHNCNVMVMAVCEGFIVSNLNSCIFPTLLWYGNAT